MFDRISRSWSLAAGCWNVLKQDPGLLIFPLLSAAAIVLLLGSFVLPVLLLHTGPLSHSTRLFSYLGIYLFYVCAYAVVMFFNTALIAVTLRRLDGEPAGVSEGLQTALSNLPAILGYAFIAATVGTILRAIEERVGFVGRIVTALVGAGWTLATAMTLPVLVVEQVGPVDAIARSLELLRSNWGENLIGNSGISIGMAILTMPLCLLAVLFMLSAASSHSAGMMVLAALVLIVTLVSAALVSTTLHAIYTAALYRFATGTKDNGGIDEDLLAGAFGTK